MQMANASEIKHLEDKVEVLSAEVVALKQSIEGLLDAWKASRGLLSIIKWLAGVASGCAIIWAAMHGGPGSH